MNVYNKLLPRLSNRERLIWYQVYCAFNAILRHILYLTPDILTLNSQTRYELHFRSDRYIRAADCGQRPEIWLSITSVCIH